MILTLLKIGNRLYLARFPSNATYESIVDSVRLNQWRGYSVDFETIEPDMVLKVSGIKHFLYLED